MDDQVTTSPPDSLRWLTERADAAFTEVQRADTKATALCGVAGGLLTVGVTVLGQTQDRSGVLAAGLAVVCVLLGAAMGVALGALRPVLPRIGLHAVLAAEALGRNVEGNDAVMFDANVSAEGALPARRLGVMAALAGRKLRAVRLGVDLVRIALVMAGITLLIAYVAI